MTSALSRLIPGLLATAVAASAPHAAAQEFTGLVGTQFDQSFNSKPTYQWRLDYQQGISQHWYFETGWVNDGHIPGHARDGIAAQLGIRSGFGTKRFVFGFATGVDRFYDTTADSSNAGNFSDVQGWLWLSSLQMSYYGKDRWIFRLQVNEEIAPPKTFDALSVLIGIGYQLQPQNGDVYKFKPTEQTAFTTGNQITAMIGQTVPNGGSADPKGIAGMAEYRHGVWKYFDLTFSYIYQGDNAVIVRNGLGVQIWPTRKFGPVSLALGFGAFFAVDQKYTPPPGTKGKDAVAGLVSPTVAYDIGDHWLARFIWNRTVTTYNENTDFFGIGLGYRWH
jgi:hypothetical protein